MRRWTLCLLSLLALGHVLDLATSLPALTAVFFVSAVVGMAIVIVAAAAWALLSAR